MSMAITPLVFRGVANMRPPEIGPPRFDVENPGNPSSWYAGITDGLTGSQMWEADTERRLVDGILGDPSCDPNMLRHQKFQAIAFMGKMYDLLKFAVELGKQNKEAEKDTMDLIKGAK